MEYLNAPTLAQTLVKSSLSEADRVTPSLLSEMESLADLKRDSINAHEAFAAKINELSNVNTIRTNDVFLDALKLLRATDWDRIPPTGCHGDLALDNVIAMGDSVALIDFHDVFFPSVLQDVAKIQVDARLRSMEADVSEKGTRHAYQRVADSVSTHFSGDCDDMIIPLEILHLLRIVPYVKEEQLRVDRIMVLVHQLTTTYVR